MTLWVWKLNCSAFPSQGSHRQGPWCTGSSRYRSSQCPCAVILANRKLELTDLLTLCGIQDSSWNCTALITKVLLHQNQSVAVRWVNYVEERRVAKSYSYFKITPKENWPFKPEFKAQDLEEWEWPCRSKDSFLIAHLSHLLRADWQIKNSQGSCWQVQTTVTIWMFGGFFTIFLKIMRWKNEEVTL